MAAKSNCLSIRQFAKLFLNCKGAVINRTCLGTRTSHGEELPVLEIHARVAARYADRCPICGCKCTKEGNGVEARVWRAPDCNGMHVHIIGKTNRVKCPVHGTKIAAVPWAYPKSRFTKDFERTITYLALTESKSAIATFYEIDWETVGKCMDRVFNELEPDPKVRFQNLLYFAVDEKSYKKGHLYVTVVTNLATGQAVWVGKGHGLEVFRQFAEELTEEQRLAVRGIAGDGASWITSGAKAWFPNAVRCDDPFHVVQWVTEACDEVRKKSKGRAQQRLNATEESIKNLTKSNEGDDPEAEVNDTPSDEPAVEVPTASEEESADGTSGDVALDSTEELEKLQKTAETVRSFLNGIPNLRYAMLKGGEHVTQYQQALIDILELSDPILAQCYNLKETLRVVLKLGDVKAAEPLFDQCVLKIESCEDPTFAELAKKLRRHKPYIMNSIEFGYSSAMAEALNCDIQRIINTARGFHEFESLRSMILMKHSNYVIPVPFKEPVLRAQAAIRRKRDGAREEARLERLNKGLAKHLERAMETAAKAGMDVSAFEELLTG